MSAGPLDFDWLIQQLEADPDVEVRDTLRPRNFTLANAGPEIVQNVVVATMPEAKHDQLRQHPQIVLEEDHLVMPQDDPRVAFGGDPLLVSPFGTSTSWQIRLLSHEGAPIPEATVYLYGSGVPAQARTDHTGTAVLTLRNESDATLRALYVNPLSDYWSVWVDRPALHSGQRNDVVLGSLADSFPGFPQRQLTGWGQAAMRLDQVPAGFDGQGIRVAVIDSGAAALTHGDLHHITEGVDFTDATHNTTGWTEDTIAHGSHCSGVIAGSDNGQGVRGFAPAAELHELRIFPGGRISSLLDAVDYCIDQQMDIVNMSLGAGGISQILLEKLAQARAQGVACIVAAGNSGDAVQFPGLSPDVLTVAAIGQQGEFPDTSYHAQQRWPLGTVDRGLFSAQFSCHGPEIDVCGPGVAIVSSVPDNGFAAWDGTSMATPHIAGLAALVLAHHPDFRNPALRIPTSARVDHLFDILKSSATPLHLGDPQRSGAGLPDALRALDIGTRTPPLPSSTETDAVRAAIDHLRDDLIAAGLFGVSFGPQSAGLPATPQPGPRSTADIRRELVDLRAQLTNAGLHL
ncbi:S8 family serine peptidase [Nocardia takedensis]